MTQALRAAIGHSLQDSTLPGAYLTPPPSHDFDPNKAAPSTLLRHGFHWRRPKDGDDPQLFEAWMRHFGRRWRPEKRIVPQFAVHFGKTHRPRRRAGAAGTTSNEITNWSGGVLDGTWTSASGAWNVPGVSQPSEGAGADGGWDSSSWVGLDGSGSNDVLQAGVQQSVDSKGNPSYFAWYEWWCRLQKQTLGDTSPLSPALASAGGRLCMAWHSDSSDHLFLMVSGDDGQTFGGRLETGESSDDAPALASDGTTLYAAWKGSGNDNLNVARVVFDGNGNPTGFANKVTVPDTSPVRPALAVLNGAVYLAWKGDSNDNLNVMVSTDGGVSFGGKMTVPDQSPQAPALAAHNGKLYMAWKGDGNDQLNVAQVALNGTTPADLIGKVTLGDSSPLCPALASANGQLYLAWRGDGNDNLNLMVSTDNGASFGGKCSSPESSSDAPVLAAHDGLLFIGWKGDGNDNLNVAPVGLAAGTITGFTTPAYLNEVQITNFAVKPGDTVHCSVQYLAGQAAGLVSFGNSTTGENFQITLVPPPGAQMSGNTAEWIMEVPTINGSYAHLPNFSAVTFSGAISCGPGNAIGNPQSGRVATIDDDFGAALTTTTLGNETVTIKHA